MVVMNQRVIILTIILFVLIVSGMFAFTYLKKVEVVEQTMPQPEEPQEKVKYASIDRINAKHYFIDGVHTLVGEIQMPTPCDLLNASAEVAESFPEQVMVDFTVINNSNTCAQVITPARFKVEATASEGATFKARLQGRDVEFNLFPAEPGETPDEFELFIKG